MTQKSRKPRKSRKLQTMLLFIEIFKDILLFFVHDHLQNTNIFIGMLTKDFSPITQSKSRTLLQKPDALAKSTCLMEASEKQKRKENKCSDSCGIANGATSGRSNRLKVVGIVVLVVSLRVVLERTRRCRGLSDFLFPVQRFLVGNRRPSLSSFGLGGRGRFAREDILGGKRNRAGTYGKFGRMFLWESEVRKVLLGVFFVSLPALLDGNNSFW